MQRVHVIDSHTGSRLEGRYERDGERIRPFITGRAHLTADSTLLIDEQNPFALGIRAPRALSIPLHQGAEQ